jgi:hypothetical protein
LKSTVKCSEVHLEHLDIGMELREDLVLVANGGSPILILLLVLSLATEGYLSRKLAGFD